MKKICVVCVPFSAEVTCLAQRAAVTCGIALLAALLVLAPAAYAQVQVARPGQLPPIDSATRAMIVDSVTAAIDSIYVLGEPAKRIAEGLRRNLATGSYAELTDPAEFVLQLERDAQAINHDGHFGIRALMPLDLSVPAGQDEDPADIELRHRLTRARNYGFQKAEILPGGVGYLKFDQFARGDEAFDAASAAMNFLANSNAVIFDLRQNGGGAAAMIRFLAGYLFEESEHLINWDSRAEKKIVQSHSADYVPGRRLADQTVYILTSERTFSAAEEFTFDLRNLERATIVGDTTGGGGHTVASKVFDFEHFRVGMRIPDSRAFNPKNNEGWEGVGVIPHIAVPAEQALMVAYADALAKLIEAEEDERFRFSLEWAKQDLDSRLSPIELSKKRMKEYVGSFGPRRIFVDDGKLWYQREGRPRRQLEPMGEDLFRVGALDYFRLSFGRNSAGKIIKVIGNYDNGTTNENPKDED
jgi:hypothetical protein